MKKAYVIYIILIMSFGCRERINQDDRRNSIEDIANQYFERYLRTFPEKTYFIDSMLPNNVDITLNDSISIHRWETFEDSLYAQVLLIEEEKLNSQKERVIFWALKEHLFQSISKRVCNKHLWNISHLDGWQTYWFYLAQLQPVDSFLERKDAISRWNNIPKYVDTEIENLQKGLAQGYSMPKEIVNMVIEQLKSITNSGMDNNPFLSPAIRAKDENFKQKWSNLVKDVIIPSFEKYTNYLEDIYLSQARDSYALSDLPNGSECYQAYIREHTSLEISGNDIFQKGSEIVLRNKDDILKLGSELFGINQFEAIINQIQKDSTNYFSSAEEKINQSQALMKIAKEESIRWFSKLPSTEVTIKPYAKYEGGEGRYEMATKTNPPYFRLRTENLEQDKKSRNEVLVFHETYPGHHIQIGLEKDLGANHPIFNLFSFTGYVEGWARYSEQLAEEMNLYQTNMALIERRAWQARGMVVDPGIHLNNWSKEKAINYIMESGFDETTAIGLFYRAVIMPGQLTSYDVGGEEIKSLRQQAEDELGVDFEIKAFHDKILENGVIPMAVLSRNVQNWIDDEKN
jgi:uncharacterized protein (DUF885 family)